jgi:50S ribosomal protein L16 3-hydroxylase
MRFVSDLETLLYPIVMRDFFSHHWQIYCLHVHASLRRLCKLTNKFDNCMQNAENIAGALTAHAGPAVQAWYASGGTGGFRIQAEHAHIYAAINMTLYFEELPALRPFADAIARDLRVPVASVVASAFVSRAGGITRMHFDRNENFTIQLRGRKRWRIARNNAVIWPTQNGIATEAVPTELAAQMRRALPRTMPRDAEEYVLKPGSVLYVPRGHWHETEAMDESLSLNISYQVVTIADLLRPTARAHVISTRAFRRSAFGGDERQRLATRRAALKLLGDLRPTLARREIARVMEIISEGWADYVPEPSA